MTRYVFKMPDLGEGTVEAEIVAWHVKVGDQVDEDQVMAEVMTEKAAVEVPAPVTGRVVSLTGSPGDMVRVGAELVVFDTDAGEAEPLPVAIEVEHTAVEAPAPAAAPQPAPRPEPPLAPAKAAESVKASRVMASPATRRRAREAGLDLAEVAGSGPSGRITRQDIDAALSGT
ncbi:MAG: biotin/lipoyl-containing protein, partial [Steroidobacteraceae bacterium]